MEDTFRGKPFTYEDGKAIAIQSHEDVYGESGCDEKCIENQLDDFYGEGGKKGLHSPSRQQPLKEEQRTKAINRVFGEDANRAAPRL